MEDWKDGRLEGWKIGRMEGWKDGRMEGWKDGRRKGWKIGRMEDWKDGRLEGWETGRMEGGKDGRGEGWKTGRVKIFRPCMPQARWIHEIGWIWQCSGRGLSCGRGVLDGSFNATYGLSMYHQCGARCPAYEMGALRLRDWGCSAYGMGARRLRDWGCSAYGMGGALGGKRPRVFGIRKIGRMERGEG